MNTAQNGAQAIITRTAKSWTEFIQLIDVGLKDLGRDGDDYVWRGHRSCSWKLISAFDRRRDKSGSRNDVLGRHRRSFAYAARGRLKEFGLSVREFKESIRGRILNENHLWALAQHHGLATPLLDWSTSPFVAAYFAFEERSRLKDVDWDELGSVWKDIKRRLKEDKFEDSECVDRAVFALNYRQIWQHSKDFEYFSPMSSEHPRLINQRGLFTIAKNGEDIESIVEKCWVGGSPWLIKILVPNDQRMAFLHGLNQMNINRLNLFPDLDGAARFCNVGLEIEKYSAFPGAD